MPRHVLHVEGVPRTVRWYLDWDATTLTLREPESTWRLAVASDGVGRLLDLPLLYGSSEVCFRTPRGTFHFEKNRPAARDLRQLVREPLRRDPARLRSLWRRAWLQLPAGLALSLAGGGLFGADVWLAHTVKDPEPWSWVWLVHVAATLVNSGLCFVLLALTFGGPLVAWSGFRTLTRLPWRTGSPGNA